MHITITDLALGGDGVGRLPDGCAVFVPFTIPGEEVEVEIVSAHKRFARARLVAVVKPSPDRVTPRCPLFGRCGGCQYQHMTYTAQVAAKTRQLRETLSRLGGFRENLPEIAVVRSPHEFGYRNKIRLEKVSDAFSKSVWGFYSTDNETILPVENCPIAMESLNRLLEEANEQCDGVTVKRCGSEGRTVSMSVRESPCLSVSAAAAAALGNPELQLGQTCRPVRAPALPGTSRAGARGTQGKAQLQTSDLRPQTSVSLTLRQPSTGEALAFIGRDASAPPLVERVLRRDVQVARDGFWQVNPGVSAELVRLVAEWAAEDPAAHLVDAYGGVGVFGLAAGHSCKRLTVIEVDAAAIRLARANFAAWGLANAEFIAQPTESALPRLLAATGKNSQSQPDVILDPPRGGCDAALLDALVKHPPRRLLYVSCSPATLARDLRMLTQGDGAPFRLARLTLLDMFPQTAHFETMAVLESNVPRRACAPA